MALSLPCGGRDRVKTRFAQVTCGHGRSRLQTGAKPVAQCLHSVARPGHLPDDMQPHPYTGSADLSSGDPPLPGLAAQVEEGTAASVLPAGVSTSIPEPLLHTEQGEKAGQRMGLVWSNGGVPRVPSVGHWSWDRL